MTLLLGAFEQAPGLKINFYKSELYWFGEAHDALNQYIQLFGCKGGELPFNYLGIPIHFKSWETQIGEKLRSILRNDSTVGKVKTSQLEVIGHW